MNYQFFKSLLLALCCLPATGSFAQDYELRAVHRGGGTVAVEVRFVGPGIAPTSTDALLDLTLDLRWPGGAGLDVESIENSGGYAIEKAGPETTDGGEEYQGFHLSTAPDFLPGAWEQDVWLEVFNVSFNSDGSTGETVEIGEAGSNPFNPDIPNINLSGTDYSPTIMGGAILPVALATFTAEKEAKTKVRLDWATTQEQNTSHFNVQRSNDAQGWETIGRVAASGASQSARQYHFVDEFVPATILRGGTAYYRLEMMDIDGSRSYSPLAAVGFDPTENLLSIYPNPTADFLNVTTTVDEISVDLYNAEGRLLLSSQARQLSLANLPAGAYRLRVTAGELVEYATVMKVK